MGSNLILIQGSDQNSIKSAMEEFDEWRCFWFDWARPWKFIDVSIRRTVWTRWSGVPIQAWTERFFILGCKRLGAFLEMHEDTKEKRRLDSAIIRISTGLESVNSNLQCRIDGAVFTIRIEEIGWGAFHDDVNWRSESESEVESKEGDLFLHGDLVLSTGKNEAIGEPTVDGPEKEQRLARIGGTEATQVALKFQRTAAVKFNDHPSTFTPSHNETHASFKDFFWN